MSFVRRSSSLLVLGASLVLWSCTDSDVIGPDSDVGAVFAPTLASLATLEESTGFQFLSPLSNGDVVPVGEFDPTLTPEVRVCELELRDPPFGGCVEGTDVAVAPAGSFEIVTEKKQSFYKYNWDTVGFDFDTEGNPNDYTQYFGLRVFVDGIEVGSMVLDPKVNNKQPAPYVDETYQIEPGSTLPLNLFFNTDLDLTPDLCDNGAIGGLIIECDTWRVNVSEGGLFHLPAGGQPLAVRIEPNAVVQELFEEPIEFFDIRLEWLDPEELPDGCLFGIDLLSVGKCFSILTVPEVSFYDSELNDLRATVSICVDAPVTAQMIRYFDGEWQALEAPEPTDGGLTDCDLVSGASTATANLMSIVALDSGLMAVELGEDELGEGEASEEVEITFGGLTSSFSNFDLRLNGVVYEVTDVNGATVEQIPGADRPQETVRLRVVDLIDPDVTVEGDFQIYPIPGATLRVSTTDGEVLSTVTGDPVTEVVSDVDGFVEVLWSIADETLGPATLTFESRGLSFTTDPDQTVTTPVLLEEGTIDVTVVEAPPVCAPITVDGVASVGEWECGGEPVERTPITVNLGGGETQGFISTANDNQYAYFLVQVPVTNTGDIFGLRFDFDSDDTAGASAKDEVIGYNAQAGPVGTAFDGGYDGYLSNKCAKSGQADCLVLDDVQHTTAVAQSDGEMVTYEFRHELNSGDGQDWDATARPIGFFGTFFNGQGAKGDSQFVGFRLYDLIFSALGF